ncbi:MAG: histidinol-phosphate transaminase [Saprospirales bacterium]|nr:histidinol-phosphate transaminase [Saprospirales bacterium]
MKKIEINNLVCPHVLNMKAYSSARMEYDGKDGVFLDANENSLGSVTSEIHNRYPDPLQSDLKKEIANVYNVLPNQLFLGNGSDECINVLIQAFCRSGLDKIVQFSPTFSMYEHAAKVMNIEVVDVLLNESDFQINTNELFPTLGKSTNTSSLKDENKNEIKQGVVKIIFICSPNNPTGNLINKNDIEFILTNFDGLVVIDEAYQDFSGNESWLNRLHEFQNLVVINTFSKSFGMADARLGMLFANSEIIHFMNTIKMPYNITQHTIQLGLEAIRNLSKKQAFIIELLKEKRYLNTELNKISTVKKVYPSDTNFILFEVDDANAVYQYLLSNQVIIRNRNSAPLLKGCLRVSVGTKQENEKFIEVLKNYN